MKNKQLRENVDSFDEQWVLSEIAASIDLASVPEDKLTEGERWKVWLSTGEKTPLDLISELANAPGRPKPGEPISDVPVPFYEPGPEQWSAHKSPERVILVAGGWRAGKSKWLAAQLLPYMFKEYAHVWIVANDYHLAREEFTYLRMWLAWLDVPLHKPVNSPQEGMWTLVTKWGATLETMTGKDEDKIEMANLNACGIAEAGQTDASLLGKVRGRVFQKRGRIFISGSLVAAQPWYINKLKQFRNGDPDNGWHSYSIPSFDNRAVFPLGEDDPEIRHMRREMDEQEFARKVLALPMPPEGLVHSEFDVNKHVVPMTTYEAKFDADLEGFVHRVFSPFVLPKDVGFDPKIEYKEDGFTVKSLALPDNCDVELAIDPGWGNIYAVLALVRWKKFVFVIDEIAISGKHGSYMIQQCKDRDWWPRVRGGTIDVAAKQHHGEFSEHEIWKNDAGMRLKTIVCPVEDGIKRLRTFFDDPDNGRPRLYVDARCENLIWELTEGYKYPRHREERPISEKPVDMNNHSVKALTYYLVINFDWVDKERGTTNRKYLGPKVRRGVIGEDENWESMFGRGR